jgi:ELWxxDGT repeat protein
MATSTEPRHGWHCRRLLAVLPLLLVFLLAALAPSFKVAPVTDINPGGDADPDFLTAVGDVVYFYAQTTTGRQFFVADETSATQLTNLANGAGTLDAITPTRPFVLDGLVYFGVDGDDDWVIDQVWQTNGTVAGTQLVRQMPAGVNFWQQGTDSFYMIGAAGPNVQGVWRSDGTAAGTRVLLGDVSLSSSIEALGVLGDTFYFLYVADWSQPGQLWRADANGATQIGSVPTTDIKGTVVYRDTIYFGDRTGRVWQLPAGADAATIWRDGDLGGYVARMYVYGDRMYLIVRDGSMNSPETLWRYAAEGNKLEQIVTYSWFLALVGMGDSIYIAAKDDSVPDQAGADLLRLPAGATVPTLVAPSLTVAGSNSVDRLVTDGTLLYMRVYAADGVELWVSDGTAALTQRVTNFAPSGVGSTARVCPCMAVADDKLFFDRKIAESSAELWTLTTEVVELDVPLYLPQIMDQE